VSSESVVEDSLHTGTLTRRVFMHSPILSASPSSNDLVFPIAPLAAYT